MFCCYFQVIYSLFFSDLLLFSGGLPQLLRMTRTWVVTLREVMAMTVVMGTAMTTCTAGMVTAMWFR